MLKPWLIETPTLHKDGFIEDDRKSTLYLHWAKPAKAETTNFFWT